MAVAMAAVMLMVAITVGVSIQSDAEGALGTEGNPVYIAGSSTTVKDLNKDNPAGLTTSIQFNRSAFTDNAIVDISLVNKNDPLDNYTAYTDRTNVGDSTYGKVAVTISESGTRTGWYSVTLKGVEVSSNPNKVHLMIKISVQEKVPNEEDKYFNAQEFYWAANLNVVSTNETINLEGSTSFKYEVDVNLVATVTNSTEGDFKYYATGLPAGVSMRVDGKIGGKLSHTLKHNFPK